MMDELKPIAFRSASLRSGWCRGILCAVSRLDLTLGPLLLHLRLKVSLSKIVVRITLRKGGEVSIIGVRICQ